MKKQLELKDSLISINKESFLIKSKNVSLAISFSESVGFTVDSFLNTAGSREVDYIQTPQNFLPIVKNCVTDTGEVSHSLVNAVNRKDGEYEKKEAENGHIIIRIQSRSEKPAILRAIEVD